MATIRRQEIVSGGDDVEKKKSWHTADEKANWYSQYGEQYGHFSKNLKIKTLYNLATPLQGFKQTK